MSAAHRKQLQTGAVATGNGETFDVSGLQMLSAQITGVTTATVQFEGSNDGGTTFAAAPLLTSAGAYASSATANGMFVGNVTGYALFRARISAYTSGTINVYAAGNG